MSEWLHFIEVILTSGPLAWVVIILSIIRLFRRPISQAIQSLESLDFSFGNLKTTLQWLTNKSRDMEDGAEGKTSNHASSGSVPIRQLSSFEIRMAALAANNPLIVIPVAWSEVSRSVWEAYRAIAKTHVVGPGFFTDSELAFLLARSKINPETYETALHLSRLAKEVKYGSKAADLITRDVAMNYAKLANAVISSLDRASIAA